MRQYFLCLIASFALLALLACGGGSSGTGDAGSISTKRVVGDLKTPDGAALAKAIVLNPQSGQMVETDERGEFIFDALIENSSLNLEVQTSELVSSISIPSIPSEAPVIRVSLILDPTLAELEIISLSFEPLDTEAEVSDVQDESEKPSPTPTPTFKVRFEGELSSNVYDVENALVTVIPKGESTQVAANGNFGLQTNLSSAAYKLRVSVPEVERTVSLGNLPQGSDLKIKIKLRLNYSPEDTGPIAAPSDLSDSVDLELANIEIAKDK